MARKQDTWTQMGDELAEWIESESDALAAAFTGGGGAPFSVPTTAAERLAFYEKAFFNPDGTPNLTGRNQQMQRLGPVGYANTLRILLQHRQSNTPQPMHRAALTESSYPGGV